MPLIQAPAGPSGSTLNKVLRALCGACCPDPSGAQEHVVQGLAAGASAQALLELALSLVPILRALEPCSRALQLPKCHHAPSDACRSCLGHCLGCRVRPRHRPCCRSCLGSNAPVICKELHIRVRGDACWRCLGQHWRCLGQHWRCLGRHWRCLGRHWRCLA